MTTPYTPDYDEVPDVNEAPLRESPLSQVAAAALNYGRRVKNAANGKVVYAGVDDMDFLGVTAARVAINAAVAVYLRNHSAMIPVYVTGAVAKGDYLYGAADGGFQTTPNGPALAQAQQARTAAGIVSAILMGYGAGSQQVSMESADEAKIVLYDDFISGFTEDGGKFSETPDKGNWLLTVVDGDTDNGEVCKVTDDGPGGLLELTTNDANADSCELQLNGEAFALQVGKELTYRTRLALKDVSASDLFVGLAITDTTVLAGVSDRVGFQVDHDGNIDCLVEQDTTEYKVDSEVDIADCAAIGSFATKGVELAFHWDGVDTVKFSIDGTVVKAFTDNGSTILIPDDEALTPTFAIKAAAAAAQTLWVDELQVEMQR